MIPSEPQVPVYLSRGIDYLGILGAKLRDLLGYATLAFELIQNADDAGSAKSMAFDVSADKLIVDNDGVFSDCGSVESPECPWLADVAHDRHMCDFHRFRCVASGDKRNQIGTAGAFGIGFTAVYQITDRPELISGSRHWILREDRPEQKRISVCQGCPACQATDRPSTRFIFPWAYDSSSTLRGRLQVDAVRRRGPVELLRELERSLPTAILFLSRLETIEIKKSGHLRRRLERVPEKDEVIVSDGSGPSGDSVWHMLRGDFSQEAQRLRELHPGRIEDKRTSTVTLAVPVADLEAGLFCAFLPTQQQSGLPFHLNADFFPSSDRKRIVLESDYQSQWNRAAIRAAAMTLLSGLDFVRDRVGHKRFWRIIEAVNQVASDVQVDRRDKSLAEFWTRISPVLPEKRVIYSTKLEWCLPKDAFFLFQEDEEPVVPVLEGLGIRIVHHDLRPHFNILRLQAVGVQLLDVSHVASALTAHGLTQRTERDALPACLKAIGALKTLWNELNLLLQRRRRSEDQRKAQEELAACAIAPGRDGALWPCDHIYRADDETVALFSRLAPEVPFVAGDEEFGATA